MAREARWRARHRRSPPASAGSSGHSWPTASSTASSSATVVPASTRDREVGGVVVARRPTGHATSTALPAATGRPPPTGSARPRRRPRRRRAPRSHSSSSVRLRSTRPRERAGARRSDCRSGSIFAGFARPDGSNASRSRACASRSSGENTSGMASRFSRPMPCSPDSTPPAATHAARISSPARCTRSQTRARARRTRSAGAGCRRRRGRRSSS